MAKRTEQRSNGGEHGSGSNPRSRWERTMSRLGAWITGAAVWRRPKTRRWVITAVLFVALVGVLAANLVPEGMDVQVGEVASVDIVAPRDVTNRVETEMLREEAARQAVREAATQPANYEINPAEALQAEEQVAAVFQVLTAARGVEVDDLDPGMQGEADFATVTLTEHVAHLQERIETDHGIVLPRSAIGRALQADEEAYAGAVAQGTRLAEEIMGGQRIGEDGVEAAREGVDDRVTELGLGEDLEPLVTAAVRQVIRPNLILSPEKIELTRQDAMRDVREVRFLEGQIIVRKGDVVQAEHVRILNDLGLLDQRANYYVILGLVMVMGMLFTLVGVYSHQNYRDLLRNDKLLALLGLIILVVVSLAKVATFIPWTGAGYLVPVALASMLVALLLDSRLAVITTIFLAVVVALTTGHEAGYVIVALTGGLAAVFGVTQVSQRSDLTRAGFIVGGANVLVMVALGLLQGEFFLIEFAFLGLINGILSAIGTIGFLPYLESMFGITSSIRLLELSNPNQPLLRKLLMEAPGSYHHSIIVGNLSEAAAEATGADGLLVRVAAQYHDVGKTRRPYFFMENQFGGENPHDKISPTLSTLIITAHVKDGVELAREYNLPQRLVDFIREHHGTDLVKYFYHRAMEKAKGETVNEEEFRYPGPRPQSKESAIVMLADSVEAAVRSLSRPTPGRIEGLVRKIIKDRLAAGQLDESDVTLRDLDKIADAFVRVLTGIFHSRVEYPDIKDMQAKRA